MKVALVSASLSEMGGGVSVAVEALSRNLSEKENLQVKVFGLRDQTWDRGGRERWLGATAEAFPTKGPSSFGFSPELRDALASWNPDIVHTNGLWMYPSMLANRWIAQKRPYVVSPHGMLDPWALKASSFKKVLATAFYERRNLRHSACIHALNDQEANAIRTLGLRSPIAIIPNGVGVPATAGSTKLLWSDEFGEDAKVLLFLGRLHPKKNVPALLEALSNLKLAGNLGNWKLAIAGWGQGNHEEVLRRMTIDLNLVDVVKFLGPLFGEDKDRALRKATAFVLPSLSEGLPIAVLEAWAYGLPVVLTAACNLPDGLEIGAAYEIPTDATEMTGPLAEFLGIGESGMQSMGQAGRTLVSEQYSWQSVSERFAQLYAWLLDGQRKPNFVDG